MVDQAAATAGRKCILIDARIEHDARIAELPSDAARWAFIVLLCEAKWQDTPGKFESRKHLEACLGRSRRYVDDLIRAGLLERNGHGLVVHAWDRWQITSGALRQRRYKARHLSVIEGDAEVTGG